MTWFMGVCLVGILVGVISIAIDSRTYLTREASVQQAQRCEVVERTLNRGWMSQLGEQCRQQKFSQCPACQEFFRKEGDAR